MLEDARLENWPDAIDRRPLVRVDSFQSPMYEYAVNCNRSLYMTSGYSEEATRSRDELWETLEKKIDEAI